jgi:hypothetical protein
MGRRERASRGWGAAGQPSTAPVLAARGGRPGSNVRHDDEAVYGEGPPHLRQLVHASP